MDIARAKIVRRNSVAVAVGRAGTAERRDRSRIVIYGDVADAVVESSNAISGGRIDVRRAVDENVPMEARNGKAGGICAAAEVAGQNACRGLSGNGDIGA